MSFLTESLRQLFSQTPIHVPVQLSEETEILLSSSTQLNHFQCITTSLVSLSSLFHLHKVTSVQGFSIVCLSVLANTSIWRI